MGVLYLNKRLTVDLNLIPSTRELKEKERNKHRVQKKTEIGDCIFTLGGFAVQRYAGIIESKKRCCLFVTRKEVRSRN